MEVEHSIEIVANVDGVRVHRVVMKLGATGMPSDAMAGFDPVMAVVRALRQEASHIEQAVRREAWLHERNGTWVDADPEPLAIEEGSG